ncbi:uncharacterized protein LOC122509922 isoform X2 [Leptopilina heterotoma]|uniref:uncharacterized protein LOC122509922 isoform X2 n=2 Tax=Leptopilina heterotoma TaxID=63436 RepID=UPI001CA95087|nr:uncharacterized protein LOC122509922 isoform X2 [Leptopilina heterotoma]
MCDHFQAGPRSILHSNEDSQNWWCIKKIRASGRFMNRINYLRTLLAEDGLLVKATLEEVNVDVDADKQPAPCENGLDWDVLKNAWQKTFFARREMSKQSLNGALWQWEKLPCLAKHRDLILLDFEKYYETSISIVETWTQFRDALVKFISSRRLDDELQELFNNIESLTDDQKDTVLITIFPTAIVALLKPNSNRKPKRLKLDTDEEKKIKLADRETFISNVAVDEDVDSFVERKLQQTPQEQGPYVVITGNLKDPKTIYLIVRTVKYDCKSIPEAFDLAVKIYLAYRIPYPTKSSHAWVLVQKIILRINKPDDKLLQVTKKALSFFVNELKLPGE